MASKTAAIKAVVLGDVDNFKKGMSDAADASEGFSERSGGSFKRIGEAAAGFLTAQAIPAILGMGADLISLGGQVDTWGKKAQTVFGEQTVMMQGWADSVNESMGLSEAETLNMATSLGDLLKPLGFTAEQAANMSKEMIGSAGALSAWSGGTKTAAEVSEIMTAAMLGETDGLKALGISISADEIKLKALSMGLVKSSVDTVKAESASIALTKAQDKAAKAAEKFGAGSAEATMALREAELAQSKLNVIMEGAPDDVDAQSAALATQALMLEKSTDAQTAWSDGTMDAVKNSNNLKAQFADLKVALAEKLTPAFQAAMGFVIGTAVPAIREFGGTLRDDVLPVVQRVGEWIGDTLGPILADFGDGIASRVVPAVKGLAGWVDGTLWPAMVKLGGQLYTHVVPAVLSFGRFLRDDVVPAVDQLGRWVRDTLIPALGTFGKWVTQNGPIMKGIFAGLAFVVGVSLVNSVLVAIPAIIAWAAAQWAAAAAVIATNLPLVAVTVALATLVAGVVWAYQNWGWFKDAVDAVARFFTDTLWPILKDVGGWIGENFPPLLGAARDAIGWIVDRAQDLYDIVSTYVFPVLETVAGWIGTYFVTQFGLAKAAVGFLIDVFGWVVDKVGTYVMPVLSTLAGWIGTYFVTQFGLAKTAIGFLVNAFQWVWDKAVAVHQGVKSAFDEMIGFVGGIAGRITSATRGMWDGITGAFRAAINAVIGMWNNLEFPGISVAGVQVAPGFGTPNIQPFAAGGLVKGGRGGVLGMIGEGQHDELVVPLDRAGRAGGLGTTINVTVVAPVGASSRDIGRELQRHLNEFARASA